MYVVACAERAGATKGGVQYDVLLWVVTAQGLRVMALTLCRQENLAVIEHVLNSLGEGALRDRDLNTLDLESLAFPVCLGPSQEGHYLAAVVSTRQSIRGPFVALSHMAGRGAGGGSSGGWVHGVAVRAQTLLHFMLAHAMLRYGKAVAAELARRLDARAVQQRSAPGGVDVGQWEYAAELLVFLALDREISKQPIPGVRVRDVVEVLAGLSVYAHAVGSCARKIDAKYWPLLFPKGNEPQQLIHDALAGWPPRPQLASIFLVIVQATAGPAEAVKAASPILAAALQMGACSLSYALAAQILGFVRRSEEASHMERQLEAPSQDLAAWFSLASLYASADEAGSTRDARQARAHAPQPLPESARAALAAHVATLVQTCNLRALSVLITAVGHDVVLGAVPPQSFPLPAMIPPRPSLSRDAEASSETQPIGVGVLLPPRPEEGHGQEGHGGAGSAAPRAVEREVAGEQGESSAGQACPEAVPRDEYRQQLMFVDLYEWQCWC
jgi:hypothetical protein